MPKKVIVLINLMLMLCLGATAATADDPTVGTINPATSITGENAGDRIGSSGVHILPSGNVIIASPQWGGTMGAVTCLTPAEYRAGGITVSSTNSLTGDSSGDSVGNKVLVLATGDYIVASNRWDNDGKTDIGAVTWVNGDTCIPYGESSRATTVNTSNSLIGSSDNDQVGVTIHKLPNGNYLISSVWSNGVNTQAGAVTWCSGITPCIGVVSPSNSLVGSNTNDRVGQLLTILSNGNYVVRSLDWNDERGAATWCHQNTGCVGEVSPANSLVGSIATSQVGQFVFSLPDGSYVVESNDWRDETDTRVGAVTWCGNTGCQGTVSASNSLVGSTLNDSGMINPLRTSVLANGNYIVRSPEWDNGGIVNAGAVTWCSGTSGCTGVISAANSMVGSSTNEALGSRFTLGAVGNYVIYNPNWDNDALTDVGAVRLCSGTSACAGPITAANSLIGGTPDDQIGLSVTALTNGNFVVSSTKWDNPTGGVIDAGAATFINGGNGLIGTINAENSLIGVQPNDRVGYIVTALTNGHYVVASTEWDRGAIMNAGAVTWGNGQTGTVGVVSTTNSMVGTHINNYAGAPIALSNGHYLFSTSWNSVGSITWCDGTQACVGEISVTNSLVGTTAGDFNSVSVTAGLSNGNYPLLIPLWDNGSTPNAGAFIIFSGLGETVGVLNSSNALVGTTTSDLDSPVRVALPNSDMILRFNNWDNGGIENAGAIIRVSGTGSTTGEISSANALIGAAYNEFVNATFSTNPDNSFFITIPNWDSNRGVIIYSPGPDNLLKNPSYESAGSSAKLANNWKLSLGATSGDRRLCDKPAKPLVRTEGKCVFQFNSTSTPTKARTLKQVISSPTWGVAGNVLTLTADIEGVKVSGSTRKILLNIKYDNNTTDRATLTIPTGTYDFTTLIGTVKLTRPVKNVTVTINVGTAKGRIRIDNLFLSASPAPTLRFPMLNEPTTRDGASPFEFPAAPDGFRH